MLTGEVPFKGDSSMDVAIKHVREGLPDVQRRRPEISAALAAVVERATAKEVTNRYSSAGEIVRDLEEVLAYETARSGETDGGVTAVLDKLPAHVAAGRSLRGRFVRFGLPALLIGGLAVAAGLVIDRASKDEAGPPAPAALETIRLGENDVLDYDPPPGGGEENRALAALALDGDRTTDWTTERYETAEFANLKDGVGLYLDVGRPVVARALRVVTPVEGWTLDLYVSNPPVPETVADWTRVGSGELDATRKTFNLDTGSQRFRYYLVWVTRLPANPGGGFRAAISELKLLG
jgi:eukaryotic-like serine/threonine-protein kinase